jgi:NAD(P)-dependent dehydrogenase (short-subunit alcohol dehydrogenase family)
VAPLDGKVVVIIGGTSGLGLSAATAILRAGGRVVAIGRDDEHVADAASALGSTGLALASDAADPSAASDAIRRAVSEFGACHALYHVAGGSGRAFGDGPLHEVTDEGWRRTIDLNLTTVLLSNRAAARHFLEHGLGGVVLNMSSVLAFAPEPQFFATHAYAAAKAAVIGLTRSAAAYYATRNIRFNAIAPGLVETPMSGRATGDEAIRAFVKRRQPLDGGRVGRTEDLDAAVVYLLSDAARFVTGQVITVDGGWSLGASSSLS